MKNIILCLLLLSNIALAAPGGFDAIPSAVKQTRKEWFYGGVKVANLPVARTEISGLARAQRAENKNYLWAVEDGPLSRIVAINSTTGADAGAWTADITTEDVEECASATINGQPYLYIFDFGDNSNSRSTFKILRCKEPIITGSNANFPSGDVEEIIVQFPAGDIPSHKDCEAAIVIPTTGDIFIFLKRVTPVTFYYLPHSATYTGTQTLIGRYALSTHPLNTPISTTTSGNNGYVTGATISPNGTEILLRSYDQVVRHTWNQSLRSILQALTQEPKIIIPCMADPVGSGFMGIQTNSEPQGEAICFDNSGLDYFTCSELVTTHGGSSTNYPLYRFYRSLKPTTTYTFQQGLNSYTGSVDTTIDSGAATVTSDTTTTMIADFDYSTYPTISRTRTGLIKWDITSIPTTAQVVQAYIQLNISVEGLGFDLFKINVPWTASSTWNTLTDGLAKDGNDVLTPEIVKWGPTPVGQGMDNYVGMIHVNLDLSTVQGWVSSPINNNGIAIFGPVESTGDGLQISSNESTLQNTRPKLVIVTTE